MLLRRSLIQPRPANHWIWFVVRGRVRHGGRYVLLLLNIILSQVRFQSTGEMRFLKERSNIYSGGPVVAPFPLRD